MSIGGRERCGSEHESMKKRNGWAWMEKAVKFASVVRLRRTFLQRNHYASSKREGEKRNEATADWKR